MTRKTFALLAAGMIAATAVPATATTITFDDIADNGSGTAIANGYANFNWSNFYALNTALYTASGYTNGTISSPNVAYNGFGDPAEISGAPFTLNSGNFTGAWNDGLTVTATGFVGGLATYSASFLVDTAGPTHYTFDWTNLSSVSFVGSGGVNHGYDGGGEHIAFDNLTVNEPVSGAVPEPATWAMMIGGIGVAGGAMRRRRGNVRTTLRYA